MTKGFSIWLDLLRSLAALAVLFGHLAHTRFTGGDYYVLREINLASDAVVVFFVISGVVIAYAAQRDGAPGRYAFNRMTRLLSVIVPALILTILFDAVGTRLDPSAYPAPYYQPAGPGDYLLRGLTLTTEWTGMIERVRLGTNGPLWSLSYELAYYLLFGIACFCRGFVRIGLLGIVALLVGFPILALLPVWLLGVAIWRLLANGRCAGISQGVALILAVAPPVILVGARMAGLPDVLSEGTARLLAPASHHDILGYSDEVIWNMVIALSVAAHLIGIARLSRHWTGRSSVSRLIRWFAGATFSIYAIHYPVLHLLDAALPDDIFAHDLLMLLLTLLAGLGFAAAFERPIGAIRNRLRGAFGALAHQTPHAAASAPDR